MTTEAEIQQQVRLAIGRDITVWRNQVGQTTYTDRRGVTRHLKYGLCVGSSDLIGIKPILIAESHVGTTIGQFVAVEVKTQRGKLSTEQELFGNLVRSKGGLFVVARDPEQARREVLSL